MRARRAFAAFGVLIVLAAVLAASAGATLILEQQAGGDVEQALVAGDHLYLALGPSVVTWSLTGAGAPALASVSEPLPGTIKGLAIKDGFLYAPWADTSSNAELGIFSLADPAAPSLAASFAYSAGDFLGPASVARVGERIYLVDPEAGGLHVLDVTDPLNPAVSMPLAAFFEAQEMAVVGQRVVAWGRGFIGGLSVTVLDASDPDAPTVAGQFEAGFALGGGVSGDLFFSVGSEGFTIFDFSDLSQVSQVFQDPATADLIPRTVIAAGSVVYIGADDGLHVWDVSNPAMATEQATVAAPAGRTVRGALAEVGGSPVALVLTELGRGLWFDRSDPLAPTLERDWQLPGGVDPTAVAASGGNVFVADFYSGLRVASAADLAMSGGRLGTTQLGAFEDVQVHGQRAYLLNWGSGLLIADVSDPQSPQLLGELPFEFGSAVDVVGDRAYTVQATNGGLLRVLDVGDPAMPVELGSLAMAQGYDVLFHQGLVLVAAGGQLGGTGGLNLIDASNPALPQVVGTYDECDIAHGVAARGDLALLSCSDGSLHLVDISLPAAPAQIARFENPDGGGEGEGVALRGGLAYFARGEGVEVVDVSDPEQPALVERFPLAFPGRGVSLGAGGRVWVAAGLGGVYRLRETTLFADGFESGDLSAWSAASP